MLALVCLGALPGCKSHNANDTNPIVSMVNAIPATSEIKIAVGDAQAFAGSGFNGGVRSYRPDPGTYNIAFTVVRDDGRRVTIGHEKLRFEALCRYTFVAYQSDGVFRVRTLTSAVRKTGAPDGVELRVVNAVVDAHKIDISLNAIVALPGIPFGAQSATIDLDPSDYQVGILEPGDGYKPLTSPLSLKLQKGGDYTLIVSGRKADGTITTQLLED